MTKKPAKIITSTKQLIAAFGGPTATARIVGISPSGVNMWHTDGIARKHAYKLDRHARQQGWLINPKLFGEKPTADEARWLKRAA